MCIWKQWKKPKTKVRNLLKMGVPKELAYQAGNSRQWTLVHNTYSCREYGNDKRKTDKQWWLYDLATAYQSVHVNY